MRRLILLLMLAVAGGLLISGQVLAADQYEYKSSVKNVQTALTGEQLRQWHLAQEQVQTSDQMQYQARVHAVELNSIQISELQRLLNQRGYTISSNENDMIGKETMSAIHRFQKDAGLAVTGMPNEETLNALSNNTGHDEFFGLAPAFGETVD